VVPKQQAEIDLDEIEAKIAKEQELMREFQKEKFQLTFSLFFLQFLLLCCFLLFFFCLLLNRSLLTFREWW
jgi:hypothetical protein